MTLSLTPAQQLSLASLEFSLLQGIWQAQIDIKALGVEAPRLVMALTDVSIHMQLRSMGKVEPIWTMSSPLTAEQQGDGWAANDVPTMGRPVFSSQGPNDDAYR